MAIEMHTWDELIATDGGFGVIVVSLSGALSGNGGDPIMKSPAVVEHFARVGSKVAITTWNSLTGLRLGHIVGQAVGFPEDASALVAPFAIVSDEVIDGRDVAIDADGGIRIVSFSFGSVYVHPDAAFDACRSVASRL